MKQMLKIELERAFKSAGLKVSLLIGIVISALHFFQKVLPTALDPLHFYKTGNLETVANVNNMWMAMGEAGITHCMSGLFRYLLLCLMPLHIIQIIKRGL